MLQEYLKLNKNILIAAAFSIIFSAFFAQSLVDQEDYLNSTFTLMFDLLIYFSIIVGLFYWDNRKKYKLDSGETNNQRLRYDLLKLFTSLGIGEVVYSIARWLLQYYFLTENYDPYLASIISQIISLVIYMIVVNLSVKMTRLFKDAN